MSEHHPQQQFGMHYLVELAGCQYETIATVAVVEKAMLAAAEKCGATIVGHQFKAFQPHGVSGAVLIAESHLTIHTWPEEAYAAIDIFTCGENMRPDIAIAFLQKAFNAQKVVSTAYARGI